MKKSQSDVILEGLLDIYADKSGLEKTENSHFEGEVYVCGKAGAIALKWADARCGKRIAIVKYGENGTISPLTPYLPVSELSAYVFGFSQNSQN